MDDLIKRQDAIDALGERPMVWMDNDDYALGERSQYDMDKLAIETVPSAHPERKQGKWIHKGAYCFACDQCGDLVSINVYIVQHVYDRFKFCPNCGADMREGGE